MKTQLSVSYDEIIALENLFAAWQEFAVGKRSKKDVRAFNMKLVDNIVQLHEDLANFTYAHGSYRAFNISDPKPRNIHKALVRDRVLHHAIYRKLYPFFDKVFIADSFSCRLNKGVHAATKRFQLFVSQVGKNNTKTVWVLKCDIRKFFASIDHGILLSILAEQIPDQQVMRLLEVVIKSFDLNAGGKGLPLGNLTSQIFCNIYMNRLDQFIKHNLKAKYYIRYADDFVLVSDNKEWLLEQLPLMVKFLNERLNLFMHPNKVFVKTLASGVDFLGWVHFPTHRVIRKSTRRRMFQRVKKNPTDPTIQSYLGLLSHGNTHGLKKQVLNSYGLWR